MAITTIDLTSPVKRTPSTSELENAIASVPEAQIRSVLSTFGRFIAEESPHHTKEILAMLSPSTQTAAPIFTIKDNKKRPMPVMEESLQRSNKVARMTRSGKFTRMTVSDKFAILRDLDDLRALDKPTRSLRAPRRPFRLPPPLESGDGITASTSTEPKKTEKALNAKLCDNCGEILSYEDDGCCKITMMAYNA